MRLLVACCLALVLLACGCRGRKPQPATPTFGPQAIVTPANVLVGKVVRVNPNSRFVVISFQLGRLPNLEQRMDVYRLNLKVGEVRITGPQRDEKIVADLLAGEAAVNDEVRTP